MATDQRQYGAARRQVEAYEESWQRDHRQAMECFDLQEVIVVGLNVHSMLEKIEQMWREIITEGHRAPTPGHGDFREVWDLWQQTTEGVLRAAAKLEQDFGVVDGADALRKAAQSVRAKLASWRLPKPTVAVGLRRHTLSAEAVAELDRIKQAPMPVRDGAQPPQVKTISTTELLRSIRP